jgi:hypothetical protein
MEGVTLNRADSAGGPLLVTSCCPGTGLLHQALRDTGDIRTNIILNNINKRKNHSNKGNPSFFTVASHFVQYSRHSPPNQNPLYDVPRDLVLPPIIELRRSRTAAALGNRR